MAAAGIITAAMVSQIAAAQAAGQQKKAVPPGMRKCAYCGNVQAVKDQCYGCGANLPRRA